MLTQEEFWKLVRVGVSVELYTDELGCVVNQQFIDCGNMTDIVTGDIICEYPHGVFAIGWKDGQKACTYAHTFKGTSTIIDSISNAKEYTSWLWIDKNCCVISSINTISLNQASLVAKINKVASFDGCWCVRCNDPVPMSAPNQPDGSFICRECRMNPYR